MTQDGAKPGEDGDGKPQVSGQPSEVTKKARPPAAKSAHEISVEFHESLAAADDEKIVGIIQDLVSNGTMRVESEDATRIEDSLSELIRRRSPKIESILDLLPPGGNSESIVRQAFQRGNFKTIPEIFDTVQKFGSVDLIPSAVRGAVSQFVDTVKSGVNSIGISPKQLADYQRQGLAHADLIDLLCVGLAKSEFTFESAKEYLKLGDQQTVSKLSQTLPYEATGEILANALAEGAAIDLTGLAIYVRSYSSVEPEKSLGWAMKLPPETCVTAVRSAIENWVESDPISASKYVGAMDKSRARDEGAFVLIRDCIKNGGLSDASLWANQIGDDDLRQKAVALIEKSGSK